MGAANVAEKPPPDVMTASSTLLWHTISPSPGVAHELANVAPTAVTYGHVAGYDGLYAQPAFVVVA